MTKIEKGYRERRREKKKREKRQEGRKVKIKDNR